MCCLWQRGGRNKRRHRNTLLLRETDGGSGIAILEKGQGNSRNHITKIHSKKMKEKGETYVED